MASLFMWDDDDNQEPDPRSGHVFCKLKDSIFMWGGYSDLRQEQRLDGNLIQFFHTVYMDPSIVWFYYPLADKWIKMRFYFPYPKISSGSGAIYVPSKSSVYLFFGFSDLEPKNCIYSFDTVQYKWTCINEGSTKNVHTPSPRDKFALWEFRNKVYFFGGYGFPLSGYLCDNAEFDGDHETLPEPSSIRGWNNQLLEFDVGTEKWREVPQTGIVPPTRAAHGATRIKDKVYIFGGRHKSQRMNDLHQLDLLRMSWTRIASSAHLAPCRRSWHSFGHLTDERHLVVVGGYSSECEVLADIWLYDIKTNRWTEHSRPSRKTKRLWHTMSITEEDDVIIFGGCVTDIYSHSPVRTHSNDLVLLRFSPDSLFRLAVLTVTKNRGLFENRLDGIPESCRNLFIQTWQISDSPHIRVKN